MKTLKDLKRDINKEKKLKERFMSLKNKEEAVSLAKSMGYEISLEELENDPEVNEDLLEAVAGGEGGAKDDVSHDSVKMTDLAVGENSSVTNKMYANKEMKRLEEMRKKAFGR